MKLYRKLVPKIARDIVRTLRHDRDIDIDDSRLEEADLDVASVFVKHLNERDQLRVETESVVSRNGYSVEQYGRVRRAVAQHNNVLLGEEGDEQLVNRIIDLLFDTNSVEEVFTEDNLLRKKIYELVKKYAGIDADLDRQVRSRIKNLREGTQEWDIEYNRHISNLRHHRVD